MRTIIQTSMVSMVVALALSGCQKAVDQAAPAAEPQATAPAVEPAQATWPASLPVFGDGFPNPGDPCRRVGESPETVDYLDDSALLLGCLSADDAAKLGGKAFATIDGVTLVSVPTAAAVPGDGDSQGAAKVAGTEYNATARIPCSGYQGAPAGMCDTGVVRGAENGTYVDVTLPGGGKRTIFFNKDGSFLSFSTAEADGTSVMKSSYSPKGDTTIATLGTERYEIPVAFVRGD